MFFKKQIIDSFENQLTFKEKYFIFENYKNSVTLQLYYLIIFFFFNQTKFLFLFSKNKNSKEKTLEILILLFQFYHDLKIKLNNVIFDERIILSVSLKKKKIKLLQKKENNVFSSSVNDSLNINNLEKTEIIRYNTNSVLKNLKQLNTKSFNIFFLRKNKIFNKGRYSRNRQNFRTGVY